ncbi:MAG: leucine-rich repeat domain-containing protein [Prevotella sp.]|nr:leucine-rich repeat domain-containing protein [Prevotella sp.]
MRKTLTILALLSLSIPKCYSADDGASVMTLHLEADDKLEQFNLGESDSLVVTGTVSQEALRVLGHCCVHQPVSYNFSGSCIVGDSIPSETFCNLKDTMASYARYVVLPEGLREIGDYAFWGNPNLAEVIIPQSVERIGEAAFSQCGMTHITLPSGLRELGAECFVRCRNLVTVDGSKAVGLKSIGRYCFFYCRSLVRLTLPDAVETIEGWACYHCSSLADVRLPASLHTISMYAFTGCRQLKDISFPQSLRHIGEGAFWDCDLHEIILPEGVRRVDAYAFHFNDNAKVVSLPSTLDSIDAASFGFTHVSLEKFYCKRMTPPLLQHDWNPLWGYEEGSYPLTATLFVPIGAMAAYAADVYWSVFDTIEEIPSSEFPVPSAVSAPAVVPVATDNAVYSLSGVCRSLGHGLNIVRMADGSVRKVVVK